MKNQRCDFRPDLPPSTPEERKRQWEGVKRDYPLVAANYLLMLHETAQFRIRAEYAHTHYFGVISGAALDDDGPTSTLSIDDCGHARNDADLERWFGCVERVISHV